MQWLKKKIKEWVTEEFGELGDMKSVLCKRSINGTTQRKSDLLMKQKERLVRRL